MFHKSYLYILAIFILSCDEAPDFGTEGDDISAPEATITTLNEATFESSSIIIEWQGNPTSRIFDYRLEYVSTSTPDNWTEQNSWTVPPDGWEDQHSWSESDTTSETSVAFSHLDEGVYRFYINGRYDLDNIGDENTLLFKVDATLGLPALRIYPLNQIANAGDEVDVHLYIEDVPVSKAVAGWDLEIQINPAELEFLPGTFGYDSSVNITFNPTYSESEGVGTIEIIGGVVGSGLHGTGAILTFKLKVLATEGTADIIIANEIFESPEISIGQIAGFQPSQSGLVTIK